MTFKYYRIAEFLDLHPNINIIASSKPICIVLGGPHIPDILNTILANNCNYPISSSVFPQHSSDHLLVLHTVESIPLIIRLYLNKPPYNWTLFCKLLTQPIFPIPLSIPSELDSAVFFLEQKSLLLSVSRKNQKIHSSLLPPS